MKKITLLTTAATAALIFSTDTAEAWRATSAWQARQNNTLNDIRDEVEEQGENITEEVERQGENIIEALRLSRGEGSSYADKQIEANKRFTDAAQDNAVQRLRDDFRARAESGQFDPNPTSCLIAGLFAGSGGSGGSTPGSGSAVASRALEDNSGADPKVQAGGTELAASVIEAIAPFKGRADGTVSFGPIFENPTLDLSQENGQEIVNRLIRNMIDSTPPRPVTGAALSSPEGVALAAENQGRMARNSAAAEVIAMRLNMIEPLVSSASYQPYVDQSAYNRAVPPMISELQAIDIRTVYDYAPNPETIGEREKKTDRALLMDLLNIMAINTRIAYISLEMQTRQATVDAAILGALNN
jgi:hypothetical protein